MNCHLQFEGNLVDLASKGMVSESQLRTWLAGSTFLPNYVHPLHSSAFVAPPDGVELKKVSSAVSLVILCQGLWQLLRQHSDWPKPQRALTWPIIFLSDVHTMHSTRSDGMLKLNNLSPEETNQAKVRVIKAVKMEVFGDIMLEKPGINSIHCRSYAQWLLTICCASGSTSDRQLPS